MLQYKVVCSPTQPFKLKKKEFRSGILSVERANASIAPFSNAIAAYAKEGWTLHSVEFMVQRMVRKKGILELIFGWIPILGGLLFPTMKTECYVGEDWQLCVLTFVREV